MCSRSFATLKVTYTDKNFYYATFLTAVSLTRRAICTTFTFSHLTHNKRSLVATLCRDDTNWDNITLMDIRKRLEECTEITPFQRRVYMEVLNVPPGTTITYGELARRIGCRSAQAVGQALKRNPFAPEVPCHRVVAADGSMGGYFGKREGEMIERKRKMIEEEQESANNRI